MPFTGEQPRIAKQVDIHGMRLIYLPSPLSLAKAHKGRVARVQFTDLLKRPARATDEAKLRKLIKGKRVLNTGAGGSIGSECVRQVASLYLITSLF